jgi:serine/threonine protein kinase
MYMERFAAPLSELGAALLTSEHAWVSLLFQVLFTLCSLGVLTGITHNDLYPRNLLVNPHAHAACVRYRMRASQYAISWPFLVALTDFGVATTPGLMGTQTGPEITAGFAPLQPGSDFGQRKPVAHILRYSALPLYSRDIYTVLLWVAFPSGQLPAPPRSIQRWAEAGLRLLDEIRDTLQDAEVLVDVVQMLFSASWMKACALHPLVSDGGVDYHLDRQDARRQGILLRGADAVRQLPLSAFNCSER